MGEEVGQSGLESRLFLFDENVTPIGRALSAVYPRVLASVDVPELGRGVDDEADIIPWLVVHHAVWVTSDWRRFRNREQARWLHGQGVSVSWFRPTGQRGIPIEDLLAAAAKAMPRLIRIYRPAGVRYTVIDRLGGVSQLPIERLLRGNL